MWSWEVSPQVRIRPGKLAGVRQSPAGSIMMGTVWGQAQKLVHGPGAQSSDSIATPRHDLAQAGDQHFCHIGASRDCRLRLELRGSSWPHRHRPPVNLWEPRKSIWSLETLFVYLLLDFSAKWLPFRLLIFFPYHNRIAYRIAKRMSELQMLLIKAWYIFFFWLTVRSCTVFILR